MSLDEALVRAANGLAADPVVATCARALSSPWVLVIVALTLLARGGRAQPWRAWIAVSLAVGLADLSSARILKPLVDRSRPCQALTGLVRVDACGVGRSFPSAHAANGFALATAASPVLARAAPALFVLAAAVAISRVVLGAHYGSDVVAGALLGLAIGGVARWWIRRTSPTLRSSPPDPPTTTAPSSPPP